MQINNPTSGASAKYFNGAVVVPGAASASAFATKGMWFTPRVNMSVSALNAILSIAVAGPYQGIIASLNGANAVVALLGSSSTVAGNGASNQVVNLPFASPIALVAGTKYLLATVLTGGLGTAVNTIRAGGTNGTSPNAPGTFDDAALAYNTVSVSAAQTASSNTVNAAYCVWPEGTF